jgi:hypothetical protein
MKDFSVALILILYLFLPILNLINDYYASVTVVVRVGTGNYMSDQKIKLLGKRREIAVH